MSPSQWRNPAARSCRRARSWRTRIVHFGSRRRSCMMSTISMLKINAHQIEPNGCNSQIALDCGRLECRRGGITNQVGALSAHFILFSRRVPTVSSAPSLNRATNFDQVRSRCLMDRSMCAIQFVDWHPTVFKCGINYQPPTQYRVSTWPR